MTDSLRLLFICSRNQWRSPTGETIWNREPGYSARSGGTSPRARHTVTAADIRWADLILVMENKHRNRLQAQFRQLLDYRSLYVLDIPDEYHYMDEDLIAGLRAKTRMILSQYKAL